MGMEPFLLESGRVQGLLPKHFVRRFVHRPHPELVGAVGAMLILVWGHNCSTCPLSILVELIELWPIHTHS